MEHCVGYRKVQGNEHNIAHMSENSIAYSIAHSNRHCIAMLGERVIARIKVLSTAIAIARTKALSTAIGIAMRREIAIACIKALSVTTLLATVNPSCDKILRL